MLANYPSRDGRLANGVGLDVPASCIEVLSALGRAGYAVADAPTDGAELMARARRRPHQRARRPCGPRIVRVLLPLADYRQLYRRPAGEVRARGDGRAGARPNAIRISPATASPCRSWPLGQVVVGLQPARGYHIDPDATYHAPDLAPPHGYLAFYLWLRHRFGAHAIVHLGKHGNLEWLPGKATALSADCLPEAVLGPLPHLYPFIVNDPGEGTQAKRRTAAVIVDHLTPPMTRAESWGELAELEALVDEYHEAARLDPRRLPHLRERILERSQAPGPRPRSRHRAAAIRRPSISPASTITCARSRSCRSATASTCFGRAPEGEPLTDLLVALARAPRGRGEGGDASLLRALAADLRARLGSARRRRWANPGPARDRRARRAPARGAPKATRSSAWSC